MTTPRVVTVLPASGLVSPVPWISAMATTSAALAWAGRLMRPAVVMATTMPENVLIGCRA